MPAKPRTSPDVIAKAKRSSSASRYSLRLDVDAGAKWTAPRVHLIRANRDVRRSRLTFGCIHVRKRWAGSRAS